MSIFSPSRYITCVERIDLDALWASGKRAILLDRDNTLVPRDRTCAPESVAAWLDHARELGFDGRRVSARSCSIATTPSFRATVPVRPNPWLPGSITPVSSAVSSAWSPTTGM